MEGVYANNTKNIKLMEWWSHYKRNTTAYIYGNREGQGDKANIYAKWKKKELEPILGHPNG